MENFPQVGRGLKCWAGKTKTNKTKNRTQNKTTTTFFIHSTIMYLVLTMQDIDFNLPIEVNYYYLEVP